jgi:hypothetical protein
MVVLEFLRGWREDLGGGERKRGKDIVIVTKPPQILARALPHLV